MKRIFSIAAMVMFGMYAGAHGEANIYLDGRCINFNDGQCGWCDPSGTPPPGNCVYGYAGCTVYAYVANKWDYFSDRYGERRQMQTVLPYGTKISTYQCGTNGWQESSYVDLNEGCNEYTYYDAAAGKCVSCPNSGVFNAETKMELPVRSRLSAGQALSGCYYYGIEGVDYYDKTGTLVFEAEGECHQGGN